MRSSDVRPLGIPLPFVEGANDALVFDRAAVPEVRAKVCAMSVEDDCLARLGAKEHKVLPEVPHRLHIADCQLITPGNLKPASGVFHDGPSALSTVSCGCAGSTLAGPGDMIAGWEKSVSWRLSITAIDAKEVGFIMMLGGGRT
jgi:hypothetical protein